MDKPFEKIVEHPLAGTRFFHSRFQEEAKRVPVRDPDAVTFFHGTFLAYGWAVRDVVKQSYTQWHDSWLERLKRSFGP